MTPTSLGAATASSRSRRGTPSSLKETFHYHFINAQGAIAEVEQNILKELDYQSTLELDPRTVDRLRHVPVANEIIVHAARNS